MKKETMITKINDMLNGMTEEGVQLLYDMCAIMSDRVKFQLHITPELEAKERQREQEVAKRKEQEETKQQKLIEEREKALIKNANLYATIEAVNVPDKYSLFISEMKAIDVRHGQISSFFPDYAIGVGNDYFNLGFMKGVKYAKAEARKKAKKESR